MEKQNKHILFCVLNWGIGHATRSIAIIEEQLEMGNHVAIASDGIAGDFLKHNFPYLTYHPLPEWNINYLRNSATLGVFLRLPAILGWLFHDFKAVNSLIEHYGYDTVISDNRFSCYSSKADTTYITHQLSIPSSGGKSVNHIATWIHRWFINHFDNLWVPDYADKKTRLAQKMSQSYKDDTHYIGPKSRLMYIKAKWPEIKPHYLVILSGPPSARRTLLLTALKSLQNTMDVTVVSPTKAVPPSQYKHIKINIVIAPEADLLKGLILSAAHIICSSGYSNIMDMTLLNKKATYIATKGQPEQEYLALIHG